MLLWVCYYYLRLPCESCPFPAEQRSPELQWDRGAGVACQGWGLAPSHTSAADLCVRPMKSCATAFLLSGPLVSVPASEKVNGEPSFLQQHTHLIVGLCCCLFFTLETFSKGTWLANCFSGVWDSCKTVTQGMHGQTEKTIESSIECRSLERFLRVSRCLLMKRFVNGYYKGTVILLVEDYKYLQ